MTRGRATRAASIVAAILVAGACSKSGRDKAPDPSPVPSPPAPAGDSAPAGSPDPAGTQDSTMTPPPGPPLPRRPGQAPVKPDTDRYLAWLKAQGKELKGDVQEHVHLRVGEWGFFDHGPPGAPQDRAGLDKAGHAVTAMESSDWHALLTTPGLDAAGAHRRIALLFRAAEIDPATAPQGVGHRDKLTAPTLDVDGGAATFQGWLVYPPNMSAPTRITITATPDKASIKHESASTL